MTDEQKQARINEIEKQLQALTEIPEQQLTAQNLQEYNELTNELYNLKY